MRRLIISESEADLTSHAGLGLIGMALSEWTDLGVDAETVWECVRRGSLGRMRTLHEGIVRTVFRGQYDNPSFALALARKDVSLATELGREFNVPMPIANLAEQVAIEAMNRGWGGLDSSATFRLQEEAAGVEVRAPHVDPVKAGKFITTHPELDT